MKSIGRITMAILLAATLILPLTLMSVAAQDTVRLPITKFVGTVEELPTGADHHGTWTIDGREVEVLESTIIADRAGPAEVGAEVIVVAKEQDDGSLQALLIRVLGDVPAGGEIHLQGRIGEVGEGYFVINGLHINYDASTNVEGEIAEGAWASVIAVKTEDGYKATDVKTYISGEDDLVEIEGEVESIEGDIWTVDGREITVTDTTLIFGDPKVGDQVEVRARSEDDGTLTALSIRKVISQGPEKVELTGTIESLPDYRFGEWVVAGQTILVTPLTRIEGTPEVGATATVTAWQFGERLVATHILVEGGAEEITFTGEIQLFTVVSRGVWVVGGRAVLVNEATDIFGTPKRGAQATVTAHEGQYGFLIATRIEITAEPVPTKTAMPTETTTPVETPSETITPAEPTATPTPVETPQECTDCLHVTGLITAVGTDHIVVNNHITAYIDSQTKITGALQVGRFAAVRARDDGGRWVAIEITTWAIPGNTALRIGGAPSGFIAR